MEDRRQRRDVAARSSRTMPSTSIGDIAVAPSNPDIVWVGTGEANLFRASMPGVGVYKSTDGGRTFTHAGPHRHPDDRPHRRPSDQPGHRLRRGVGPRVDRQRDARRVQDDRRRPDVEEGVLPQPAHRRDRSRRWIRRIRTRSTPRCGSASGGSGAIRASSPATTEGGIWKTTDGGKTWTDASQGLPAAQFRGRIGIDVARSNPNVALRVRRQLRAGHGRRARASATRTAGRSSRRGSRQRRSIEPTTKAATWRKVSRDTTTFMIGHSGTYGWVFGQIRVDPTDENTIYTLGLGLNVSRDAGKTFTTLARHARRPSRALDRSGEPVDALQRQRRRLLPVRAMPGKTWTFARRAGGVAVLQRDARHEHAGLGLRIDSGRRQPARQRSISSRGRDRDSRRSHGRTRQAAKDRITRSIRPTRTSSTPTASTATSRAKMWPPLRPSAPKPRPEAGPGTGPWPRGRDEHPAARRNRPAGPSGKTGHDAARRSGWRRSSPRCTTRRTIYAGYQFVFRSDESRRAPGRRSAPTSPANDPAQMLLEELERDSVSDDRRAGRIAAKPGPALCGHRRRPAARDDGRREDAGRS